MNVFTVPMIAVLCVLKLYLRYNNTRRYMYAHEYMYSLAVLYYALAVPQTSLWVAGRALGVFILDGDDDVLHKTGIHTRKNDS